MLLGTTRHLDIHRWSKLHKKTTRSADIGKYLMGVKVHLSSLNCDIDGDEIILELPDFVHLVIRVCKVTYLSKYYFSE